jgi:hypothetical protein
MQPFHTRFTPIIIDATTKQTSDRLRYCKDTAGNNIPPLEKSRPKAGLTAAEEYCLS